MATLTVQTMAKTGLTPSYASAAGGGDAFTLKDKNDIFHAKNGSGGAIVMTFVTQSTVDGLAVADRAVSVGAGSEEAVSDLDPNVYRDSNGLCQVTYDGVTSLTVAHLRSGGAA